MPIPILCPCSAKLRVLDSLAGLEIQCPKCLVVHPVQGEPPTNGHARTSASVTAADAAADVEEILERSGFSEEERAKLREELEKGERLVWAAKPDTRMPFYMGVAFAAGSCFLAGVFLLITIITGVQGLGWGQGFVLGPLGLVVIAAGMACPIYIPRIYQKTAYAITNRRAMIWDQDWFFQPRFKDYGPEDVAGYKKIQGSPSPEAVGSIEFARELKRVGSFRIVRFHGFFYIKGVAQTEKILREHLLDRYTDALHD